MDYNRRAREKLAGGGTGRFWAWEIAVMFYGIAIVVDGHAEAGGMPPPKNYRARRAAVERRLCSCPACTTTAAP